MIQMSSVALRVDAGEEMGLGHLRRCITLANQLRDDGYSVRLVCSHRFGPAIATLAGSHPIHWMDEHAPSDGVGTSPDAEVRDADATIAIIGSDRLANSWVVVDSYRLGHRWERRVRDAGHKVVVIDDFRNRRHHADLLVSDSNIPFESRLNDCSTSARTLVGRDYALIEPEYAYVGNRAFAPPQRKRLLVSYGGSDPTRETGKALAAVEMLRGDAAVSNLMGRVEVAVGPLNSMAAAIASAAKGIDDCGVHVAPHGLARLMQGTDLILTAGGNSLVEGLALRKPCLVTVTSDNQTLMVAGLVAEGAIRKLGTLGTVGANDVAEAIADILIEYDAFAMQVAARPLFDHLGARRIAAAMLDQSEATVDHPDRFASAPGAKR